MMNTRTRKVGSTGASSNNDNDIGTTATTTALTTTMTTNNTSNNNKASTSSLTTIISHYMIRYSFYLSIIIIYIVYSKEFWDTTTTLDFTTTTTISTTTTESSSTTTSSSSSIHHLLENKIPKPLTLEQTVEERLFVHIGKAGGSSIQVMVEKSRQKCQELSSKDIIDKKDNIVDQQQQRQQQLEDYEDPIDAIRIQTCAIEKIPSGRVHMKHRLGFFRQYKQFLVNVRNPIDRIISWYNYELLAFQKEGHRWNIPTELASQNFIKLSQQCYPHGIQQVIEESLLLVVVEDADEVVPATTTTTTTKSNNNHHHQQECKQLAKECLLGNIMCYGHNFYNYEVYVEDLLLWKGLHDNHDDDDTNNNNNNNNNNDDLTIQQQQGQQRNDTIRVDVIRSEHSMDDFERIIQLWTKPLLISSSNLQHEYPLTDYVRGLYGRQRSVEDYKVHAKQAIRKHNRRTGGRNLITIQKDISQEGVTALCTLLCIELVIYKKILLASDNLYGNEIWTSYQELDRRCGFVVDDVCGTKYVYRNIKQQKHVHDMPW